MAYSDKIEYEGQEYVADTDTGEAIPLVSVKVPVGSVIFSPQQIRKRQEWREAQQKKAEKAAERRDRQKMSEAKKRIDKALGNFTICKFPRGEALSGLKPETQARLVYLATYLNHNGALMFNRQKPMTKELMRNEVMKLSTPTFYRFYNELAAVGMLKEDAGGNVILSEELYCRGKVKPTGYDIGLMKVYNNAVRSLYENTLAPHHKFLGAMFRMIPFLNIKYNVLCHDPFEENLERVMADTIDMNEFCALQGLTRRSVSNYRSIYEKIYFPINGVEHRFCVAYRRADGKEIMLINPLLMHAGREWKSLEALMLLFASRDTRVEKTDELKELAETNFITDNGCGNL